MKRRIIESLVSGIILILISTGMDKYGGFLMKEIYQTFIAELWWMWIGVAGFLIYFLFDYIKGKYREKCRSLQLANLHLETMKIYLQDYMRRLLIFQGVAEKEVEDLIKKFDEKFK